VSSPGVDEPSGTGVDIAEASLGCVLAEADRLTALAVGVVVDAVSLAVEHPTSAASVRAP